MRKTGVLSIARHIVLLLVLRAVTKSRATKQRDMSTPATPIMHCGSCDDNVSTLAMVDEQELTPTQSSLGSVSADDISPPNSEYTANPPHDAVTERKFGVDDVQLVWNETTSPPYISTSSDHVVMTTEDLLPCFLKYTELSVNRSEGHLELHYNGSANPLHPCAISFNVPVRSSLKLYDWTARPCSDVMIYVRREKYRKYVLDSCEPRTEMLLDTDSNTMEVFWKRPPEAGFSISLSFSSISDGRVKLIYTSKNYGTYTTRFLTKRFVVIILY